MDNHQARALAVLGARALFTDTSHGNLGLHVGDDERAVRERRASLDTLVGAPVLFVNQIHSARVEVLRTAADAERVRTSVVDADALVTNRTDIALAIMVADCLPVLLSDPTSSTVAAVHAGRRGLLTGILPNAVEAMQELGAAPSQIRAVIGPSICGSCYEVPAQMRKEAGLALATVPSDTSWGTPALDLAAGARESLEAAGLPPESIVHTGVCTLEDPSYFSYRRNPNTGRFAGVIAAL